MILVTGATGFLGSRVVHRLKGRPVRVLVRARSDTRRIDGLSVERVFGDVTDARSIERAMRGVKAVIHCAAHYQLGVSDPERMRRTNVEGTRNVLCAAANRGAIAVHVSSVAALGPTEALADESHWSEEPPRSVYAATKREAHVVAKDMGARIVLPGTIYGPDDPSPVGRMHALAARGLLPIGFRKHVKMSLVFVDDCADAVVRALECGRDADAWIAASDVVSFGEWFEAIARATRKSPPRAWIDDRALSLATRVTSRIAPTSFFAEALRMSDGASWAFSSDKARRDLGWSPRTLERGLEETMAHDKNRRALPWIFASTR